VENDRDLQSDLQQEDPVETAEGHDPKKTAAMKSALRRYALGRAAARGAGGTDDKIGEIYPIEKIAPI
jgi:hypothetical protein